MSGIKLIQNGVVLADGSSVHPAPITIEAAVICYLSFTGTTTTYEWSLAAPTGSHSVISSLDSHGPTFVGDIDGAAYSVTFRDDGNNIYVLDIVTPTPGVSPGEGVPATLSTIASLRVNGAASAAANSYSVQCYYTLGDQGGGIFDYDAADTTSADDGGVIIVCGTRRYRRRISGNRISNRWFGVRADGAQFAVTAVAGQTHVTAAVAQTLAAGALISVDFAGPAGNYASKITNVSGSTITVQDEIITTVVSAAGFIGDGNAVSGIAATQGTHTVTKAGFTTADIGKNIYVFGAGQPIAHWTTVSSGVSASTTIPITDAVVTSAAGVNAYAGTDDQPGLQRWFDYTRGRNINLQLLPAVMGQGGQFCTDAVHLERGIYMLGSTVRVLIETVTADQNATLVGQPVTELGTGYAGFQIYGAHQTIEGVNFAGFDPAIRIFGHDGIIGDWGSPIINNQVTIKRCSFRYPTLCVQQYAGSASFLRQWVGNLVIEDCFYEGCHFLLANCDNIHIHNLNAFPITNQTHSSPPILDSLGNPLGVVTHGGFLTWLNLAGAPSITGFTFPWVRTWSGTCSYDLSRFGGEGPMPTVDVRQDGLLPNGDPIGFDIGPSQIFLTRCPVPLTNRPLIRIFVNDDPPPGSGDTVFPSKIHIGMVSPSTATTPNQTRPLDLCTGIYLGPNVDLDKVFLRPFQAISINLEGNPVDAYRVWQAASDHDPGASDVVDLTHRFRQYEDSESSWVVGQKYPNDGGDRIETNLYFPDVIGFRDHDNLQVSFAGWSNAGTETATGLIVDQITATADGNAYSAQLAVTGVDGWDNGPAGEYCFSAYVKASWSGNLVMGRQRVGGTFRACKTFSMLEGQRRRIFFTFYHDGADTLGFFAMGLSNAPNGATFGMSHFMVNQGTTPAKWCHTAGSLLELPIATLQSDPSDGNASIDEQLRSTYVRRAIPTKGAFMKGDKIININPLPGNFIEATCYASGFGDPTNALFSQITLDEFDPTTLAGLKLWVKASDKTLTGADVATLTDLSGNGNDLPGIAGKEPLWVASDAGIANRPCVEIEGTIGEGFDPVTLGITQPVWVFIVRKTVTVGLTGVHDIVFDGDGVVGSAMALIEDTTTKVAMVSSGGLVLDASADPANGNWIYESFKFEAPANIARHNATAYTGSGGNSGNSNPGGFTLGCSATGTRGVSKQRVSEVLIVQGPISDDVVLVIEDYLKRGHGL